MMKDEVICVFIFFALVFLFVFNSYTVDNLSRELTKEIETAEKEAISDFDAEFEFNKVREKWEREKKVLFYLCGHGIITQIDESINLSCQYLELGDRKNAVYMLKKARIMLHDLSDREKIKLDNIF